MAHGIVSNHGFVDGNKRTAVYLVELLALRSGYRLVVDDLALADAMTAAARGETEYEELVTWFQARLESSGKAQASPAAARPKADQSDTS